MSYVANDPGSFADTVVGDGQCVAFVKSAAGAPQTTNWTEGQAVKGNDIPAGAAIATFQNGKYTNSTNGDSHAAIYISQDDNGILVWDQWKGQAVHQRVIRFKGGNGVPRNDGDAFSVIE